MHAPALPPEVIHLVLDAVEDYTLYAVLAARHVSRAWRVAARSHPAFARNVTLSLVPARLRRGPTRSAGAIHLFLDQLAATPGGVLNLQLDLSLAFFDHPRDLPYESIRALVIPAPAECLPRLVRLTLRCTHDLVPDVLAALRTGPAPRLAVFKFLLPVRVTEDHLAREELPSDLFAGSAPLLRTLQMDGCQFPARRAVPALAGVRVLMRRLSSNAWEEGARDLHPERFFVNCPALEELAIDGSYCPLSEENWTLCPPPAVTNLRRITVMAVDKPVDMEVIVRAFAHPCMEDIDVSVLDVDHTTSAAVLSHLDDSPTLELQIVHELVQDDLGDGAKLLVHCVVYDAPRRRRRTFTHYAASLRVADTTYFDWVAWALLSEFSRVAHRFTSISLPGTADSWLYLTRAFNDSEWDCASLANMTTITITLSGGLFDEIQDAESLMLPALTHIRLIAEADRVHVHVDDLDFLVRDMFAIPAERPLRLELVSVSLIGELDDLDGLLELVTPIL